MVPAITGGRLRDTREALHTVGEWLLAGPQYVRSGTIRLKVVPGGITTKDGLVAMTPGEVVSHLGTQEVRTPVRGSVREIGAELGIVPSIPTDLYSDHAELGPDDPLSFNESDAAELFRWFELGESALRIAVPGESPVLWPEHFDVATSQAEVNFGVSLGDSFHEEPYAYVGPWAPRSGRFWNAPFGAARPRTEFSDTEALGAFFTEGARLAVSDPPAAST
jgi:hypothetical protein